MYMYIISVVLCTALVYYCALSLSHSLSLSLSLSQNDTGSNDPTFGSSVNVFTTFIKARISCSSGSGIPYHYNNIQDTFLVQSGSYDGSTNARHLYAVFSSAE